MRSHKLRRFESYPPHHIKGIDMKISTSYFYQIRNFKPHMIPISTAIGNPKWYEHKYNISKEYVDNNGVLNGITFRELTPAGITAGCNPANCNKDITKCAFCQQYKAKLNACNFEQLYAKLTATAIRVQHQLGFNEEPHLVLMVHEKPDNPCSERLPLQQYFQEHGIPCQELEYPIN